MLSFFRQKARGLALYWKLKIVCIQHTMIITRLQPRPKRIERGMELPWTIKHQSIFGTDTKMTVICTVGGWMTMLWLSRFGILAFGNYFEWSDQMLILVFTYVELYASFSSPISLIRRQPFLQINKSSSSSYVSHNWSNQVNLKLYAFLPQHSQCSKRLISPSLSTTSLGWVRILYWIGILLQHFHKAQQTAAIWWTSTFGFDECWMHKYILICFISVVQDWDKVCLSLLGCKRLTFLCLVRYMWPYRWCGYHDCYELSCWVHISISMLAFPLDNRN